MSFGLSHLSGEDAQSLSQALTLSELESAVNSLNLGKAPGIDGLTVECYIKFWQWFAPMLIVWVEQTILLGRLCGAASTGVITLIPQKNDPRDIGNWRPITLMTVDAKILSRALAIRLNGVVDKFIPDFQNCIPGRSIHRSLAMVRDVLACAKIKKQPINLLSLDQAKAFDRINHDFLFRLLNIIKLPSYMIQAIKSIYTGYTVVLKNADKLSRSIKYIRGIRQGDPLSTILYALAFLPALTLVKMALPHEGFPLPNGSRLLMTAYADDATFFLEFPASVDTIVKAFSLIAKFSEAELNLTKSVIAPFYCNQENVNLLHENAHKLIVSPGRITILGVLFTPHLGIDQEQWDSKLQQTRDKILDFKSTLVANSYFDRAHWISTRIWPRWAYLLKAMQPSTLQLHQLKVVFAQAIWLGGKHWMDYDSLIAPRSKGGLSLISPTDRIYTMRVMFTSKTISEGPTSPLFILAESILGLYAEANLGFRVLHTVPEQQQLATLPPFYKALFEAWDKFPLTFPCNSINTLMEMPCFSSRILIQKTPTIIFSTEQAKAYGAFTIKQLYTARHRITRQSTAVKEAIISAINDWDTEGADFEGYNINAPINEEELRQIRAPQFVLNLNDKIYTSKSWCNKLLNTYLQSEKECQSGQEIPAQTWKTLRTELVSPTAKNHYWRFLHCKVPNPSLYNHMGITDGNRCILCEDPEADMDHQFCTCPLLGETIDALSYDVQSLGLPFLQDQKLLYPGGSHAAKLANICIIFLIYMVIVVTRSVANSRAQLNGVKIKNIYFDLLAKHIVYFARSAPPSDRDKRFKWLVLTHGNLIARWSANTLQVRTSSGFRQYSEDTFNLV